MTRQIRKQCLTLVLALGLLMAGCAPATTTDEADGAPGSPDTDVADEGEGEGGSAEGPQFGGSLVYAQDGDIRTLDPLGMTLDTEMTIGYAIYDQLLDVAKRGDDFTGQLAESMTSNEDFTRWTMVLREGIEFHDGEPFNAEAVKYNFDRHMDPDLGSSSASFFATVESLEILDEFTLEFTLSEPWANFPFIFTGPPTVAGLVASPKALEEHPDDYTANAVGTGPYTLVEWVPDDRIVLKKNPNYWQGEDSVYLDEIIVRPLTDPQTRFQSVMAGDVAVIQTTVARDFVRAEDDSDLEHVLVPGNDIETITINVVDEPWSDVRLRQALYHAIDLDLFVEVAMEGRTFAANGIFPPDDAWNTGVQYPQYDPDLAARLVADYEAETGEELTLDYVCAADRRTMTELIERSWADVGIDVTVHELDVATRLERFFAVDYEAMCISMAGYLHPDLLPYRFFHSEGNANGMGFESEALDRAVDAARQTNDLAEQRDLWATADQELADVLPWIWLSGKTSGQVYRPGVQSVLFEEPERIRGRAFDITTLWLSDE